MGDMVVMHKERYYCDPPAGICMHGGCTRCYRYTYSKKKMCIIPVPESLRMIMSGKAFKKGSGLMPGLN